MHKRIVIWTVIIVAIIATLGGTYAIVKRNSNAMKSAGGDAPTGFFH